MGSARAHAWLLGLLLGVTAAPAAAQQGTSDARARAGMSAQAAAEFDRILADARARGLPVAPLVDKALEGQAKRVPPERIGAVVRQLAEQLARARTILGTSATTADLVVVADVLQRGVSAGGITRLRASVTPGAPIGALVRAYGDIVAHGVPEARALDLLVTWEKRRDRGQEPAEVASAIERLIREGQAPAQAAAAILVQLRAGGALQLDLPQLRSDLAPALGTGLSAGAAGAVNGIVRMPPLVENL